MIWLAIAGAALILVLLLALRFRASHPSESHELSAYHDGLDALDRLRTRTDLPG
jgi:hypothetical protein